MKKFNTLFNTTTTSVKINGSWYKVSEVHPTKYWIKVKGLLGSFQRGHIESFTNKAFTLNDISLDGKKIDTSYVGI